MSTRHPDRLRSQLFRHHLRHLKMMIRPLFALAAGLLLGSGVASAGIELSLSGSATAIRIGETVAVEVIAAGLGDFQAPSLGAFGLDVTFDPALFALVSADYGAYLGDPSDPDQTDIQTPLQTGVGWVHLDELSWLFPEELDALQPASFALATLTLRGLTTGVGSFAFGAMDLSDAEGVTLVPDAATGTEVRVTPAPGGAWLLLCGLPLLAWVRRRAATQRFFALS